MKKKGGGMKDFFPHEVVQHKKCPRQKLPTFNNVSNQLFIAKQYVCSGTMLCGIGRGGTMFFTLWTRH